MVFCTRGDKQCDNVNVKEWAKLNLSSDGEQRTGKKE